MEPAQTAKSPQLKRWRPWLIAIAIAAACGLGILTGIYRTRLRHLLVRGPSLVRVQSLAVLPFKNMSSDPEQAYFADGMTEELITELAKISSIRLISRTSVMHYKNTQKSLPQIARELNVDAVVEGSILRWGSRVRMSVQLITPVPERHIWADV